MPPLGSRMLIKATVKVTPGQEWRLHLGGGEIRRMGGADAQARTQRQVLQALGRFTVTINRGILSLHFQTFNHFYQFESQSICKIV